jgi:mannitol-1-phosphate/altronate dehydrogenase
VFIDTERCIRDQDAKAHIVRIAAERIAPCLRNIPTDDREYELFQMARFANPLSSEIEDRVIKLASID